MIVVFDSNIWQSDLYRWSGPSAAVRFYLRQGGAKVAIPEVVRWEVEAHIRSDLNDWIKNIRDAHRQLLGVFGTLKEVVLPTEADIDAVAKGATASLGLDTIDVPFSAESARAAFMKIIRKEPPCAKTQEFKDAVIWHDCLHLAEQDDVTLVTKDGAFYRDLKYENGLANNLRQEAASLPHTITILSDIAKLLKHVKIDKDVVSFEAMEQLRSALLEMGASLLSSNGFAYDAPIEAQNELYATEQIDAIFVKFTFSFRCVDTREEGRTSALLSATGDVIYNTDSNEFQKVRTPEIRLSWETPDGTHEEKRGVYLFGHGVIGHRDVSHPVRYRL